MRNILFLVLFLVSSYALVGQSSEEVLTLDQYFQTISYNHPIAKQALLIGKRGDLSVKYARGAFDPKLMSDYNSKAFNGKDYYETWNSYVKIPTILNVDLKAGYERNRGIDQNLNPQNEVPSDGLYYAGVSIPIGQGLIHNPRNIALKQAKVENLSLENQANAVLNNLMLDALYAYWNWYEKYNKLQVIGANQQLIADRYELVKENVKNGEYAAIDSIEMFIQVQEWQNNLLKAELEYNNSVLLLQNYLWNDDIVLDNKKPVSATSQVTVSVDSVLLAASETHPDLKAYKFEIQKLELDRKLSAEQLKPVLNFNYNFLISDYAKDKDVTFFENNYKAGFEFSYPLFTRKERSKLKMTKIKKEETTFKLDQKTQEVVNKVRAYHNKVENLEAIVEQQDAMIDNYQIMVQSEQIKFDNGESSLFVLNKRQDKLLAGEIKLIEFKSKYAMSQAELRWNAGILAQETISK